MSLRPRSLRCLFPPSGPAYELFNSSMFLLAFGLIGYVIFNPPDSTADVLSAPLRFITEDDLGMLMTWAAGVGIVTSYFKRALSIGYVLTITVSLTLCLNFALGAWGAEVGQTVRAGILNAVLYGYVTRNLIVSQRRRARPSARTSR